MSTFFEINLHPRISTSETEATDDKKLRDEKSDKVEWFYAGC